MAITVEALELNVKTSADSAATSVQELIKKLGELKTELGTKFAVGFGKEITAEATTALRKISNTAAGEMKKAAKDATKSFSSVADKYKSITGSVGKFKPGGAFATKELGRKWNAGLKPHGWEYGPAPLPDSVNMVGKTSGTVSDEEYLARQEAREAERFTKRGISIEEARQAIDAKREETQAAVDAGRAEAESANEAKEATMTWAEAVRMTKEELLQMKMEAAGDKVQVAIDTGDPAKIASAVTEYQRWQAALQDLQYSQQQEKEALDFIMSRYDTLPGYIKKAADACIESGGSLVALKNKWWDLDEELKRKPGDAKKASEAIEETGKSAHKSSSGVSKFMSSIGRIARTLVIRTALRNLMKEFSSAWEAAYEYSKHMKGDFAKSVEEARGAISHIATTIVQTFAPVLTALSPIINHIASSITYLCEGIQNLISLLGISSELFGATSEQINKYASGSGKASNKNKNMLASFDELTVIQSETGSSSGTAKKTPFKDMVQNEIAEVMNFLVDEALLAVGLILAFSGHVPIGLGLAALGAAGMVKTLTTKWGGLTDDVKGEILSIMTAVGGAELAVGSILAFAVPGKRALGIALMAMGAANMATAVAMSWNMSDDIKKQVALVTAIVGTAFLAVGAILAFAVPGKRALGIGLMATGAVSMGAAVALNWNGLVDAMKGPIGLITGLISGALVVVGAILAFSGANIPLGIGLLAAGGIGLAAAIAPNWEGLKAKITKVFKAVGDFITGVWNTVTGAISGAWEAVKKWWNDGIGGWISNIWESVKKFFSGAWESIKKSATDAWDNVKNWWNMSVLGRISSVWNGIKQTFVNIWEAIKRPIEQVWNFIKDIFGIGNHQATYTLDVNYNDKNNLVNKDWNGNPINSNGNAKTTNAATANVDQWLENRNTLGSGNQGLLNSIVTQAATTANNAKQTISKAKNKVESAFGNVTQNRTKQAELTEWAKFYRVDLTTKKGKQNSINLKGVNLNGVMLKSLNTLGYNVTENLSKANQKASITQYSTGGIGIPSGQLFVAREAGAELVGKIGRKTTVANNEQIVSGIASGISQVMTPIDRRLERIERYVGIVAEKEPTVRLTPSVALGRVNAQSAAMYGKVTGR